MVYPLLPGPDNSPPVKLLRKRWQRIIILCLAALTIVVVLPPIFLNFSRNLSRFISPDGQFISVGMDFDARYNEICCVREGTDPYLVRTGDAYSDRYAHYLSNTTIPPKRRIDAYSPWSYTFFYWLTFLPEQKAWHVFYALMVICLCVLPISAFVTAFRFGPWVALGCACASLFLGFPITACLYAGNYGLFMAAALFLFIWAMQTQRHLVASVAWALMMVKPQTAVLLAIPLLLQKKIGICLCSAGFCFVASLLPAILCHRSVISMILEILQFGSTVATQTKLFPGSVMHFLSPVVSLFVCNLSSALLGLGICVFLSWQLRKESSWLIRVLPAVVMASFWTYCLPYNDCTLGVVQIVFFSILVLPFPKRLQILAAVCFFMIPLLHVQRLFSAENAPWSIWKVLGLSFSESSLLVRFLSVIHVLAAYLLLSSFVVFCLTFSKLSFGKTHVP